MEEEEGLYCRGDCALRVQCGRGLVGICLRDNLGVSAGDREDQGQQKQQRKESQNQQDGGSPLIWILLEVFHICVLAVFTVSQGKPFQVRVRGGNGSGKTLLVQKKDLGEGPVGGAFRGCASATAKVRRNREDDVDADEGGTPAYGLAEVNRITIVLHEGIGHHPD